MLYFFKQKTSYDMRIRYLSSDVCSSDLTTNEIEALQWKSQFCSYNSKLFIQETIESALLEVDDTVKQEALAKTVLFAKNEINYFITFHKRDRNSVVKGKSVSVRGDLGGGSIIKKKKRKKHKSINK